MSASRSLVAALLAVAPLVLPGRVEARGTMRWSDLKDHPRIVHYKPEKDLLIRQSGALNRSVDDPPGGKESYSGNRLRQYRFLGKPGRGGIYDAFEEYPKMIGADPKNYKYRLR